MCLVTQIQWTAPIAEKEKRIDSHSPELEYLDSCRILVDFPLFHYNFIDSTKGPIEIKIIIIFSKKFFNGMQRTEADGK